MKTNSKVREVLDFLDGNRISAYHVIGPWYLVNDEATQWFLDARAVDDDAIAAIADIDPADDEDGYRRGNQYSDLCGCVTAAREDEVPRYVRTAARKDGHAGWNGRLTWGW